MEGYFDQIIEKANKRCDEARSMAMTATIEVPGNETIKDCILSCCKVYYPSHSDGCIGFEIELRGILSKYHVHPHGHVFEALGFSFAKPLLIELKFQPQESISLEAVQGESLSGAYKGLFAMHGDVDHKISQTIERKFVYDGDSDERTDKTNPMPFYGLQSLLPRIAQEFFSRGGRDPDNLLLACEDNIFVRFLLFTGSHLASLLKQCIVCNKELPFSVSSLCSCGDELCMFRFEELGLGAQILQELVRMPSELIDLEISLALAAVTGCREVFQPFPPFFLENGKNCQHSDVSNPKPRPNSSSALRSIIGSFPSVSEIKLCVDEAALKGKLAKSWLSTLEGKSMQRLGGKEVLQLPYKVLRFILCTNRLSLVFLSDDDDKLLKLDNSDSQFYQFAVVQDSPEREASYIESCRNKDEVSRFGFHGSITENWYSIMRNGLRCLSNTKLSSGVDMLGAGLYLSKSFDCSANHSIGYTGYPDAWKNRKYESSCYVVSLCEIVNSSPKIKDQRGMYVVPKELEGSVAIRYLFVSPKRERLHSLGARIFDGHILSRGGDKVDLSQHYHTIRQKYASGFSSQ